jgi:antitoxin YefM
MRRLHASDAELARGEAETLEALDAAVQRRRRSGR